MERFYVYIIVSEQDGRYYYGQSSDLRERINQHNAGYSGYTSKYLPWKLVAFKDFTTRSEAMQMELKLKNCKSKLRVEHFLLIHGFQKVIGPEK